MDHAKYFKDQAAFWSNTPGARKHVQHYLAAADALDRVASLERELAEARKPCPCKVREAADLLDATTPRPWPPPEGVEECFAWRKQRGWFAVKNAAAHRLLPPEFQPEWWMPMPPEPEVDRG